MHLFTIKKEHQIFFTLLIYSLIATFFSLVMTGFEFGINNNVFHIPYVLNYDNLPAFKNDAFYQSLDKFTSAIWPLLRLISSERNVENVFFVSFGISRALAFISLVWFFKENGIKKDYSLLLIILMIVATTPFLSDFSFVGKHGLFLKYFTHSEVSWGPLLAGLVAAQLGRLRLAVFFASIVFLINAFIGVWLIFIIATTVALNPNQRSDWKLILRSIFLFFILTIPVVIWIALAVSSKNNSLSFNYLEYIKAYYPQHFLIDVATRSDLIKLTLTVYCGLVAAFLTSNKRFWLSVMLACIILFIIGSILPYVFNYRFIFNLHLLRSDGILQFIAIILIISVFIQSFIDASNNKDIKLVAVVSLIFLISVQNQIFALLFCSFAITFIARRYIQRTSELTSPQSYSNIFLYLGLILILLITIIFESITFGASIKFTVQWFLVLILLCYLIVSEMKYSVVLFILWSLLTCEIALSKAYSRHKNSISPESDVYKNQLELIKWISSNTITGPFLFPIDKTYINTFSEFQLNTKKPVWVDWKQGAAVMWEPSFYWQWMPRMIEVNKLKKPEDFSSYAKKNDIQNLILPVKVGICPINTLQVFKNRDFSVCTLVN